MAANNLLNPQHPVLDVDALHSKGADFWPILMSVNGPAPVMIALYYGSNKPSNIDELMSDFIQCSKIYRKIIISLQRVEVS